MSERPVLPYGSGENASSGYSDGATSRERAERADRDGTTAKRQQEAVRRLLAHQHTGLTWKELARITGWHHGQTSGTLSNLHKVGRIARLAERRDRCFVYVLPEYVSGRDTQEQGRKQQLDPSDLVTLSGIKSKLDLGWVCTLGEVRYLVQIVERLSGEKFLEG